MNNPKNDLLITATTKLHAGMVADVIVPRSGRTALFTYAIPQELTAEIKEGLVAALPLRNKMTYGVVWKIHQSDAQTARLQKLGHLKSVKKVVHKELGLLPYQKELAMWMSEKYIAPLSDCIFSFLPIIKTPPKNRERELQSVMPQPHESVTLTQEQQKGLDIIHQSEKPVLLHGVTGSGKTEVYMRYAQELLSQGKDVLILVPEIALTPQTKKRFESRFGNVVAVWHSELGQADRRNIWWQINQNEKKLVVGSRSALFLPFKNLGLIVIDEEHEKTFYQESSPRYDARDVAEQIHVSTGAKLILGSATPSLETVWKVSKKQYLVATLQDRISQSTFPQSVLIDLRQERLEEGHFISQSLLQELQDALARGHQSVLLLNRRGHSTSALCTTCGLLMLCKNCNIPLTVHNINKFQQIPILKCHHCDYTEPAPALCPRCQAPTIVYKGFGTEKVESELKKIMPNARILRMDRDTTSTRNIIDTMYHDFAAHKYDILLGTQMIAKGWDIANVDLVGILLAESGLMLPDYHAAANTFNLLVQVAGRSGRGKRRGKTIIQTYQPDHPLIRLAANHDFGSFVKQELKFRKEFAYPPFSTIVRLLYQHKDIAKCQKETEVVASRLNRIIQNTNAELLGPTPCFFERLRGKYRFHIILKIKDDQLLTTIKPLIRDLKSPWTIEINPGQLL